MDTEAAVVASGSVAEAFSDLRSSTCIVRDHCNSVLLFDIYNMFYNKMRKQEPAWPCNEYGGNGGNDESNNIGGPGIMAGGR